MDLGYYGIQLTSGRYTSYWNAFLFILCRSDTYLMFLNKFHPIESTFIRFCFWSTLCFKQISVAEGRVRKVEDLQTMTSHKPMAPQILKTSQANQLGKNPEMFKKSNMMCLLQHSVKSRKQNSQKRNSQPAVKRGVLFHFHCLIIRLYDQVHSKLSFPYVVVSVIPSLGSIS